MRSIYSKIIVSLVILLNYWIAREVLDVFRTVGSEPQVLIGCWFAFTTGELWLLSGITREKVRRDADSRDESII